ncbi:hypothetical protein [Chryseobacterium sp. POL2]|uniref:hypothetical protein n=1 Tax=Chryseobacterium sp. POL2 TaxID=2713414 RepID=UPI001E3742FB|nr:hypothetical protein [Chryseobacterium sp. POL2]
MKNLQYPLEFKFKITTLSSDFTITDQSGQIQAYARQKLFKFKESVQVYESDAKRDVLYNINANQWIDFNASYSITEPRTGTELGKVARKGMRSFWRATYEIFDNNGQKLFTITEENPWVKMWDSFVGELPIIGMFTGYFLNPAYIIKDTNDQIVFRLKKTPSLLGRRFELDRLIDIPDEQETLCALSLMMMILLERGRG